MHAMRVSRSALTAVLISAAAVLPGCGYGLGEDPEMEEALYWAQDFQDQHPELSRAIAKQCEKQLTSSPYLSRDGALQLFQCVRRQAEAQGYA
jgi:hypothetical protein